MLRIIPSLIAMLVIIVSTNVAYAHAGSDFAGGFWSGLTHPVFGWDHVVAMVAVGLWGAVMGAPAIWLLPIVFPVVMAVGAALGIAGVPIPYVEAGIAISGAALGLLVAFLVRAPIPVAAVIVGLFAIFHGHAHGTELSSAYHPLAYGVGFVISTGLLHMVGIVFGALIKFEPGKIAVRIAGAAIALIGAAFLFGLA